MPDAFAPVVTEAGFTAALAAETGGLRVNISHVAVGSRGYAVPVNAAGRSTSVGLIEERQRVEIQDARDVGNGQTDISFVVDGPGDFHVREIGFYLDDGTLFAVASHPGQALIWKSSLSAAAIALELVFDAVNPDSITVISAGPPLQLLMTRELAVLSRLSVTTALRQLKLEDRLNQISGDEA